MNEFMKAGHQGELSGRMKYNRGQVWCIFICLMLILFMTVLFTCEPKTLSNDDEEIGDLFVGVWGEQYATPYVRYINVLLGWIMYALYKVIPSVNWFIVYEEGIILASFCVLQMLVYDHLQKSSGKYTDVEKPDSYWWKIAISFAITASFAPTYLCRISYTQTTAVGCMTGMLWVISSGAHGHRKELVPGCALTCFSAMLRFEGFLLTLPFVFVFLLAEYLPLRKNMGEGDSFNKVFAALGGLMIFCGALFGINELVWNSEELKSYKEFNASRSLFMDYPKVSYDDAKEEFEEIGISENDYHLICSWQLTDEEFITADLLQKMADISETHLKTDYKKETVNHIKQLFGFPLRQYNHLWVLILVFFVLALWLNPVRALTAGLITMLEALLMETGFVVVGRRYPAWVQSGILFCTISVMITSLRMERRDAGRKYTRVLIPVLCAFVCFPLGSFQYISNLGRNRYDTKAVAIHNYLNAKTEDLFFFPVGDTGGCPSLRKAKSIFRAAAAGEKKRIIGLGGWGTNAPAKKRADEVRGVSAPMRQTDDSNVYLVTSIQKSLQLRTYLEEHTGRHAYISLWNILDDATIWKFTGPIPDYSDAEGLQRIERLEKEKDGKGEYWTISVRLNQPLDASPGERYYLRIADEKKTVRCFMAYGENSGTPVSEFRWVVPCAELPEEELTDVSVIKETSSDGVFQRVAFSAPD